MKALMSSEIRVHPNEGIDLFLDGKLKIIQSKDGYRFSIDAVFLSEFATIRPDDVVVDLGTGCGVIPLIILLTKGAGYAFGLEIQKELADQAARNAAINGIENRMKIILGDIRYPPLAEKTADVVVCNPPYRKMDSGRINPDLRRAIARHELLTSIDDILRTAAAILKKRGRFALIYPAERLVDILIRLRRFSLEPKRMQINHPDCNSDAKLVLIEAVPAGRAGLKISHPLIGQGNFSNALNKADQP